jgi:xylogalacturonan beta-1,3-xylosyltransferase
MATFLSSPINCLLQSAFLSTLLLVCLSPFYQPINISSRLSSFYTPNFQPYPSTILLLPPPNTTLGVGQDAQITWKIKVSPFDERLRPSRSPVLLAVQNITVSFSPRFPAVARHERVSLSCDSLFAY